MASAREELAQLLQDLDDDSAAEVLEYVRWLLLREDEPLTPEEIAEVREAEAEIAGGEYVTLEQLERDLGL